MRSTSNRQELLGEQAGNSLDQITRNQIAGGTTVQYAGGVAGRASVAAANVISVSEIRKAVRTLKTNNAKAMPDGSFVGILHPKTEYDLQGDAAWVNFQQYAGSGNIIEGEVGKVYGVRFVSTTNAKTFAAAGSGGIDVYATLILGVDAYVVADLEGAGVVRNIVKPLGSSGTADPLLVWGAAA